jgi:ATP-binding cassette subfamily F protein 3
MQVDQDTEDALSMSETFSLERAISLEASVVQARVERDKRDGAGGNVNAVVDDLGSAVATRKKEKSVGVASSKSVDVNKRLGDYFKYLDDRRAAQERIAENMFLRRDGGASGPKDILCDSFDMSVGDLKLLENATLHLAHGRRYGIVGRNGSGKTTLLRHISEYELEGVPKNLHILHVEQEIAGDDRTALETVLAADQERTLLLNMEKRLLEDGSSDAAEKLKTVYERMAELDVDSSEGRAAQILAGLQFTGELAATPTKRLSGGWRMRVALARALFISPEVLLLDEPTNHLDLHAVLWLHSYLQAWTKTLIVVSHSRTFLNAVVTDIIHLHHKTLTTYRGDFDTFEKTRRQSAGGAAAKAPVARSVTGKKVSDARSHVLEGIALTSMLSTSDDSSVRLRFPACDPLHAPLIQASAVSFSYTPTSPSLFSSFDCTITTDSRIAVVGANGAGKTTLLSVLFGDLEPSSGFVLRNPRARIAKFSQHSTDVLDIHLSAVENMVSMFPTAEMQAIRSHLGAMGVSGDMATRPLYTLSGGQKARVSFAVVTWPRPHLILLDEPTNHLDMESTDALIHALNSWDGGAVIVSHDETFVSAVCDEIWQATGRSVSRFDGDFTQYKAEIMSSMGLK